MEDTLVVLLAKSIRRRARVACRDWHSIDSTCNNIKWE